MDKTHGSAIVSVDTLEVPHTFLPRQVQQPARDRCDRRGPRPEDDGVDPDGRSREEDDFSLRGARAGS